MRLSFFTNPLQVYYVVLFWGSYALPIYSFEKIFRIWVVKTTDLYGIYNDSFVIFMILAVLPSLIFPCLKHSFRNSKLIDSFAILFYIIFYLLACSSIAYDYRIHFGSTWRFAEIFHALVKPQWFFYLIGGLGIFFNYKILQFIPENSTKIYP